MTRRLSPLVTDLLTTVVTVACLATGWLATVAWDRGHQLVGLVLGLGAAGLAVLTAAVTLTGHQETP